MYIFVCRLNQSIHLWAFPGRYSSSSSTCQCAAFFPTGITLHLSARFIKHPPVLLSPRWFCLSPYLGSLAPARWLQCCPCHSPPRQKNPKQPDDNGKTGSGGAPLSGNHLKKESLNASEHNLCSPLKACWCQDARWDKPQPFPEGSAVE